MSVILCLAEMQQGSLLQELVKKKIDCDTWPVGCRLFMWNLFKGLLNSTRIQVFSKSGWENRLF